MANDTHKTIDVPQGFIKVTSRGTEFTTARLNYPPHIMLALMDHGLSQKLADSASQVFADVWTDAKGKDASRPNKAERQAFAESHADAIRDATLAAMQKANDALMRGDWQVRVANGTSTRSTPAEALALQMAQDVLAERFGKAAIALGLHDGPADKCPARIMAELGDVPASFFNLDQTRVTWNKDRVREYVAKQAEADGGTDFMAMAHEELARQEEARQAILAEQDDVTSFDDL